MIDSLSDVEKRAVQLMTAYDATYESVFNQPFWPLKRELISVLMTFQSSEILLLPTFVRVVQFLATHNIPVCHTSDVWRDYVAFALRWFAEQHLLPAPIQLCNHSLVRRFAKTAVVIEEQPAAAFDYTKYLLPHLRTPEALRLLGLS